MTAPHNTVSPYLELPLRDEAEMRRVKAMGDFMDTLFRLTPAQEWLASDHVTKKLEQFRKEDEAQS